MTSSNNEPKLYPPTRYYLDQLRKKGQWYSSKDLAGATVFATLAVAWSQGVSRAVDRFLVLVNFAWQPARIAGPDPFQSIGEVTRVTVDTLLFLVLPITLILFCVSAFTLLIQVGPLFSTHNIVPSVARLNPGKRLKHIWFEPHGWLRTSVGLVRLFLALALVAFTVHSSTGNLILSGRFGMQSIAHVFNKILQGLLWKMSALYLMFGAADFLIERRAFIKRHHMTREEMKEERQLFEQSPEVRQRFLANWASILRGVIAKRY
jgi:flagellar biosynthetic protein FlhB